LKDKRPELNSNTLSQKSKRIWELVLLLLKLFF
jgi:hypothetical protein